MKKLLIVLLLYCTTGNAQIVRTADFETGNIYQGFFGPYQLCLDVNPLAGYISDSFARNGTHSVRLETNTDQLYCGSSYRAMLNVTNDVSWYNFYQPRIAFSTYLPSYFQFDNSQFRNELYFQIHIKTKRAVGNPVVALWLVNDQWYFRHTYDTVDYMQNKDVIQITPVGTAVKGIHDDWVFLADFTIDNPAGFIKLYRNGVLVVDKHGSNFNKENGVIQEEPYFGLGPYKFGWKHPAVSPSYTTNPFIRSRVIFADYIRFGSPSATYADFQSTMPTPPAPAPTQTLTGPFIFLNY